jgi:hypothetical protein
MVPTTDDPADPGFSGYRLVNAGWETTSNLPYLVGEWTDQLVNRDIGSILAADGLLRGFELALKLPQEPENPGGPDLRNVKVSVHEFADADGAFEALNFISYLPRMSDGTVVVQLIRGEDRVGDGTALVRTSFESGGNQGQELEFLFRIDRVIALIQIWDYTNQEPPLADAKAMATGLLKRIETALAGQTPGLGPRVLRLPADATYGDQYVRSDGKDTACYYESADKRADRTELAGDATDAYEYLNYFEPDSPALPHSMRWTSRIFRFSDDGAAAPGSMPNEPSQRPKSRISTIR